MPSAPEGEFDGFLRARLDESVVLVEAAPCEVYVKGVAESIPEGCRAVVVPYAGVPPRTLELVAAHDGVALFNLHHNAAPTAELAMALLLAAAKRVVVLDRALRAGDWRPRYAEARDLLLEGRTAIVLGAGAVGSRVAKACSGLGMDVVALGRKTAHRLAGLLPQAHALVVCVPWTGETEGMIGAAELAALPDGAVVVNVARGPVVREQALYEALASGRLRAGLDVWYEYPKDEAARERTQPSTRPFFELDNVVMSPHRGGQADETERLRAEHLAGLLLALARGEEPDGRVDVKRGY